MSVAGPFSQPTGAAPAPTPGTMASSVSGTLGIFSSSAPMAPTMGTVSTAPGNPPFSTISGLSTMSFPTMSLPSLSIPTIRVGSSTSGDNPPAGTAGPVNTSPCKCIPGDPCWPSNDDWASFNSSVSGRLISTAPIAAPCYPGTYYDPTACAAARTNWKSTSFRAQFPAGYSYTDIESCDLPGGNTTACGIGDAPVYAVDARTTDDVSKTVLFARQKNLRLVIKTTGHDYLHRSTGLGGLEIWLYNLRLGLAAEPVYIPTAPCAASLTQTPWPGAAMSIKGGYTWTDVHPAAQRAGLIVVGSACPEISALGGFTQGGGYSPASGQFGLAAEQLLEAEVILADGSKVTASACQNPDLFNALRGGGGGTYGVVTAAKIKAYRDAQVATVEVQLVPRRWEDVPAFMSCVAFLYQYLPILFDMGGGLSGTASWGVHGDNPAGLPGPSFSLVLGSMAQTSAQIQALFAPVVAGLGPLNGTQINFSVWYGWYSSYHAYYDTLFNACRSSAGGVALTSRLLRKVDLADANAVAQMLNVTAGKAGERTSVQAHLLGPQGRDATATGLSEKWREAYVLQVVRRGWEGNSGWDEVQGVHADMTGVKGAAMAALAPGMGAYGNEGDVMDQNYLQDFHGGALPGLQAAKARWDPDGVFYCGTCVGSDAWTIDGAGRVCKH